MYGIFTYIWVIFGENVDKYSIHGAYGYMLGSSHLHDIWLGYVGITLFAAKKGFSQNQEHANCCYLAIWMGKDTLRSICSILL